MDLKDRNPQTRRVVLVAWTLGLGAVYFVVLPEALRSLNAWLSWPRWDVPGGAVLGPACILVGAALVLHCNRLFSRIGQGSIVPIDPTRKLVVRGPYRYSRNPVYVGYLAVLLGLFLLRGELLLLVYVGAFRLYLEPFVRTEEKELAGRFGAEYEEYRRSVPRWLGRFAEAR